MRDDVSAHGTEDERDATYPFDINDPTKQAEYSDEVPEEVPPEAWEEENTDDLGRENEADLEI